MDIVEVKNICKTYQDFQIKQRIGYSTGAVSWFPRKTIKKSQWQRMM